MFSRNLRPSRRPKRIGSRTPLMPLLGGLICGVLIVVVFRATGGEEDARATAVQSNDTVSLPVPSRLVARGESLAGVKLTTVQWPSSLVPPGALKVIDPKFVALTALPPLTPITSDSVTLSPIHTNAVIEGIPDGMRAISVHVDAESAVEGWARSGTSVDVILVQRDESSDTLQTSVIANNVKILSAGSSASTNESSRSTRPPDTVTLLVTQEDALKIKTASLVGKLTFSLRNATDTAPPTAVALDGRQLVGKSNTPLPSRNIRGRATGPDGQEYVLDDKSRWSRSEEVLAPLVHTFSETN